LLFFVSAWSAEQAPKIRQIGYRKELGAHPPLPNLKVNIQGRGARGGPGLAWTVQGGKIAGYTGLG